MNKIYKGNIFILNGQNSKKIYLKKKNPDQEQLEKPDPEKKSVREKAPNSFFWSLSITEMCEYDTCCSVLITVVIVQ